MDDIQTKIAAAKAAGYTADQIAEHLSSVPGFGDKVRAAKSAGYKSDDIISHLSGEPSASAAIPATTTGLGSNRVPATPAAAAPVPQPSMLVNKQTGQDTLLGKLYGPLEAATTLVTGAGAGLAGAIRGGPLGALVSNAKNAKELEAEGGALAEKLTYSPRTQTGNKLVQGIGTALQDSGIVGIPIPELNALGRGAASSSTALRGLAAPNALAQGATDAAMAANPQPLRNLLAKPAPAMAGGGAASTAEEAIRAQRFAQFGIKPTKGQLTRTMEDVGFEREAAKTKEGKAIDGRYAEQNAQVQSLFNDFNEQTGAQASSLRAGGKTVVGAVEMKKAAKKAEFTDTYKQAEAAGEMADPVNVKPLMAYLADNQSSAELAPIVKSIQQSIMKKSTAVPPNMAGEGVVKVDPMSRVTTLNDLEKVRQQIRSEAQPGTPNMAKGQQMIALIDQATEGKGGPLFQQARRQFENYSNEFTDRGVIDKLLRDKPGTGDRAVAYEDVMKHSILDGSLDDTRHVFRVLEAHPAGTDPAIAAAGKQAANELRGALTDHIKEKMFGNAGADTSGKVVGSQAKIKAVIKELDADGKLEAVYGKQGAQTLRDVADMSVDLYTNPTGSVNYSNTATKMEAAMNKLADRTNAVPVIGPVLGPTARFIAKRVESNALAKKVDAALNPPQNALAQPR